MQNVIVGYDGSEQAKRALDRAASLGRAGAKVTVVGAVSFGSHGGSRSMGALNEDEKKEAADMLDAARAHLATQGIDAHSIEGEGDAADVIVEAAEQVGADLIVVGTRGRGTGKRALLGSVSTKVAHHAPCDVLIVR
jgi:nucleotide-binding universal stress UspA family protein